MKILRDQRYQEGAVFGNHREQEDGIKYHEETDSNNIRRGYWEYPSEDGRVLRTEFEAGPGIGFRITKSNHLAPTPVAAPKPVVIPAPAPVQTPKLHAPVQVHAPIPAAPIPVVRATTPQPGPINIFDYPANLDFSRHSQGHRFKFAAV